MERLDVRDDDSNCSFDSKGGTEGSDSSSTADTVKAPSQMAASLSSKAAKSTDATYEKGFALGYERGKEAVLREMEARHSLVKGMPEEMEPIEKLSFYPSGERKRCKTACVNCRETRIRCVMLRCGSCSSCVEQGIPCVERVSKKRGPAPKPKQGAEERNHAVEPTHGGQKRARSPLPPRPPVVSPWLQAPSIVPPPAAIAPQWGCPSTVLPHAAPTNDHSVWSRLAAMQGTFLHTTHARRPPLPHAMISHSHPGLLNACSSAMQLPFPFQMPGGVDAPPRGAWGGQLLGPSPYPEVNMGFSGVPRPT